MASLYDEKVLGAKDRIALARKLQEQSANQQAGQMVSGWYVPNTGGAVLGALNNVLGAYEEKGAKEDLDKAEREKTATTMRMFNSAGIRVPEEMALQAGTPEQKPSWWDKTSAFVTGGEQPQTVPAKPLEQNVAQNVTPDQFEQLAPAMALTSPELAPTITSIANNRYTRATQKELADALRTDKREQFDISEEGRNERAKESNALRETIANQGNETQKAIAALAAASRQNQGGGTPSYSSVSLPDGTVGVIDHRTGNIKPYSPAGGALSTSPVATREEKIAALADNAAQGSMSMANIPKDLRGDVAKYLKDKGVSPGDIVSGVAGAKVVQATEKDFSPLGLSGRQIVAAATANNHLSAIEKAHQAMQNGDSKQFNAAMNAIGANTGNPAPTTFDAARRLVAPEIAKVIFGAGAGGVKEREGFAESFNRDMSPEQFTGTINQTKELFKGRLEPLANAYTYGTKKPFDWKGRGIERFQPENTQQPVQQPVQQAPVGIPPQTDIMAEMRRRGLVK